MSQAIEERAKASELWSKLRFDPATGSVWLDEQRMLLLHTGSLGALRAELIRSLGEERAAGLLLRMGYHSGVQDAEIARRLVGKGLYEDVFLLGPALHQLEGVVEVETVSLDLDLDAGEFAGEFIWRNGWETQAHVSEFGVGDHAACWNQLGYATGYVSAFMGRRVQFREIECRCKGDPVCRIVGESLPEGERGEDLAPDNIASEIDAMAEEIHTLRRRLGSHSAPENLVGQSPAFLKSYRLLERAADSAITVLLLGETGVGKEVFAQWLHDHSPRRDKPFVAVNCGAIPHDLIESELFGAEAGAYTGAKGARAGRFARADGGTLFLDEIGDLPYPAQVKLLRALQTGEIDRLGSDRPQKVDVRLIAATNVDLQQAVAGGKFRADLFYRLNPYPIEIPPLRERAEDIPAFVDFLLARISIRHGRPVRGLTDKAMEMLRAYDWPGNIRELENVLERGVMLAEPGGAIDVDALNLPSSVPVSGMRLTRTGEVKDRKLDDMVRALPDLDLGAAEARMLDEALRRSDGDVGEAAKLLGLTRRQIDYRLKGRAESGE
ncbi:sigma 54-interacting transcriptional regulator [Novosphingobium profundi]|uniref:sigma-54-dependent Fis family transcriptional regulator n=1 Tax=Novosphingobium profundi TaxID=1774954 RepID=UPI001BDAE80B|nr:sigma-54-dependent Fis family transcriptional regulator [Novosphingobium profundi]MBT0670126.1 sigma 54-interacting transcriptional regulator [Novosphingobium profundi]